ncbi:tyrosine-type recombinase/integrase [Leptolyngbya sp. FACHB-671]|uniref:site-specific integrase n=1 Tax=Leptolyngbya sp. FACHB-671 TaxID=2692812 RepID=UPI001683E309|nr:site-specific integrase [Leptolyngbya sp. FACHB-671]MBD2067359.1 tyrosine-type recombinase/integrase [Leptolyngbya sp. FACHB-671]
MNSNDTRRKASKGSVQIKVSNSRLQLVFSHAGKRHYLSLGFSDTPEARALAEMKASQIRMDMISGHFDETLAKYKPEPISTVAAVTPISTPENPSLAELWERFVEYKRPQCSENTMMFVYGHFTKYLHKLPTHDLDRANEIRDYSLKTFPIESCKRFITRLNACCDWAMKSGWISANPFSGMASEIKPPKSQKSSEEDEIFPFSLAERDSIIEAIAENKFCKKHSGFKHDYYRNYVEFLFMTGCRPSEALALQWKHISNDFRFINFEQALIETSKGKIVREGLKTQDRRRFPCNGKVQNLLQAVRPEFCDPESSVFPGYTGGYLDTRSFRKNVWKPVLEGLGIEYRKPYQTRHTFITLALENGLDAKDVARLVGNSPEVIYRHYAGNKRELVVPEF